MLRCRPSIIPLTVPLCSVYLDPVSRGSKAWPAVTIVDGIPDIENVGDALKNGKYGQCVYESANDVVDHQVRRILLV